MTIAADVQSLAPGSLVELFELDATGIGGQVACFHGHRQAGPIVWRGVVYAPWPIAAEGFERTSSGRQPVPTLKVGNVDGSISSLCLALADLVGAKITRRRTLSKYLDAINFPVDVVATNQRFGTGDGVKNKFQLVGPGGLAVVKDSKVTLVRQSDWQGDRLLYPTPRTNTIRSSQDFSAGVWGRSASGTGLLPAVTANAGVAPDGTNTATRIVFDQGAGASADDWSRLEQGQTTVAGDMYAQGIWLKATDGRSTYRLQISFSNAYPFIAAVTPAWTYFENASIAMDAIRGFRFELRGGSTPAGSADVLAWGAMRVRGDATGVNIPTTVSAVTVTDYVAGSDGVVQLAVPPARAAALTWSGSGTAGNNPAADPNEEMPPEVWLIERKSHEDNESVEFELSSPLDFDGEQLPRRQIIPNLCTWAYRGPECGYTGGPCADANDAPTADPAKDRCSQSLRGCKFRFGANNPLPYGGFPAAGLVRT